MSSEKDFLNVDCPSEPSPLTTELFDVVDGVTYPEMLVMDDVVRIPNAPGNPRFTIEDMGAHKGQTAYGAFIYDGLGLNSNTIGYRMDRGLAHSNPHHPSYEKHLNIRHGQFSELLKRYCSQNRKSALRVGDFGCGRGKGLKDILDLPEVDREKSFGITMHSSTVVRPDVRDRVVCANIARLKPNHSCPDDVRVDVFLSVHGVLQYHPLNSYQQGNDRGFGILHAINMTRIGGLILTENSHHNGVFFEELFRMGIISAPKELTQHFIENGCIYRQCVKLIRYPTFQEVSRLLKLNNGVYQLQYFIPDKN